MRETKYRAWDKKLKEMFPVHELKFSRFDGTPITIKGYTHDEKDMWNVHGGANMMYANASRYELLEYTGLMDKNGKEIYEGDIIKYSFRDGNDTNTRFMQIYNDGVNFKMKELYRDYWLEKVDGVLKIKHGHLTKYRGETNLLCDVSALVIYWYEVIGNIYENPDLLEGIA